MKKYSGILFALVLAFSLMLVPAKPVEAFPPPPTFTFSGGSLTASLGAWGGTGYVYPPTFDVTAPGGIDITFYDVDGSLLENDNGTTPWQQALKGVGMPGLTAGTTITSIDPAKNSVYWTMVNLNSTTDHDWNSNPVSTLGPDGTCFTSDDTRHWGFQDWYRPATGGKIAGVGEDPYYNPESYVTPNDRFTTALAHDASFYNTFDLRIKITHTGDSDYNYEMWVRMHNCASVEEGCQYCDCGVYNHAINNCGADAAWRQLASGGSTIFPIDGIDLTAVHPFVGLGNYPVPATHTVTWGNVVVTGTPTAQAEVWVDGAWTGYSYGDPADGHIFGYDAFAKIQDGIDAVAGSTVHVAAGTYTENVVIAESLALIGASSTTTVIDGNDAGNTVTITASDVSLSGFTVTGGSAASGHDVFYPEGGVVVDGNDGASALTGITILDNIIRDNLGNGVYVSAAGHGGAANNVVIEDCHIYSNGGSGNYAGVSLTHPNYILRVVGVWDEWRRPKNILVQGNTIHTNSSYGLYLSAGEDNVILSNEIWDNSKYGLQLASSWNRTDIPCEYTTVEDNEIHDNTRNGVKLTSYNQHNTFTGNTISNNGYGGTSDYYKYGFLFQDGNDNIIENNTITGNALGGLYLWGKGDLSYTWYSTTNNSITGNTISNHTGHGIYIPALFGNPNSGFLNSSINFNNITNNSAYGLENADTTQTVDAECNWWGHPTGPGGIGPGTGDAVSDYVIYEPWLLAAAPDGLCGFWVDIDIKPGSDPNSINLGSKGVVPVAVLTTDDFDAGTVDPATVLFAGAAPVRWAMCDVDGDDDIDLILHFKTQGLVGLDGNSTEATLTGDTFDGLHIKGTDTVNIVPKGKGK